MAIEAFGKTGRGCVRGENEDRKRGDLTAELAADAVRYYIGASRDRYDVSWPFGYVFELSLDANRLATMRNVVTQSAGPQPEVEVHLHEETMAPGDALLICSDGLYNLIQEPDILAALAQSGSPETTAKRLVEAAVDYGAPDNVSAVVLRFS